MKASSASIRVLLACAGVLLLFGVVSAFAIGAEDDDEDAGRETTTTLDDETTTTDAAEEDDEVGDESTTTSSSSTSSSSSSTTSTTARGATTTTRPGATTTTRPGATTTTSQPGGTTTTAPDPDAHADLVLSRSGAVEVPDIRFTIQNAGPNVATSVQLVISVSPDMTIVSATGREGMTCGSVQGTTVTCTAADAPVGGRVGGADVQVSGNGLVQATASSATNDPDPSDNSVVASA